MNGPRINTRARRSGDRDISRYQEEVACLAYQLWEQRDCAHGDHEQDWFRALEEIRRRRAGGSEKILAKAAGAA